MINEQEDLLSVPMRNTLRLVAILNLSYFGLEFATAIAIGSVSLFADSVDFLEDTTINILILVGLGWGRARRARLGLILAGILLVPSIAALWTAWNKLACPEPPLAIPLTLVGLGALVVNLTCAYLIARYRTKGGSLLKAAYLSARNDGFANVAIIAAGFATLLLNSIWPDLLVGIGIAILNASAAREVWNAAMKERQNS